MMIKVTNLLDRPRTFTKADGRTTFRLAPYGSTEIDEDLITAEMYRNEKQTLIFMEEIPVEEIPVEEEVVKKPKKK